MLLRRTMSIAVLTGLAAALAGAGIAQGQRPDARAMSCDEARALVRANGAVVLTTGRHTYDRYVADGRYCSIGEAAVPQAIRTRDGEGCFLHVCRMIEPSWD